MERPEAMDYGTIILTGLNPEIVIDSINLIVDEFKHNKVFSQICPEYQIENTSMRVLKIILGTIKLNNNWWGK